MNVWTDGGCRGNPGPGAWGVVGDNALQLSGYEKATTNNSMEWTALIHALNALYLDPPPDVKIHSDSLLIVNQFNGKWKAKDERMAACARTAQSIAHLLRDCGTVLEVIHVPRSQNKEADALVNEVLDAHKND